MSAVLVMAGLPAMLPPGPLQPSAAQPAPFAIFVGTWTATAGAGRTFRGTWSARSDTPNKAVGSWTLVNPLKKTVSEGTWAAEKVGPSWRGTWSAATTDAGRRTGRTYSGTWEAMLTGDGTLASLLQRATDGTVSGSWRSGGLVGTWSLQRLNTSR